MPFDSFNQCLTQIQKLPPSELKYYSYLTLVSLENDNKSDKAALNSLIEVIDAIVSAIDDEQLDSAKLMELQVTLSQFKNVVGLNTWDYRLAKVLAQFCGCIGAVSGMLTGFTIGAMLAFRLPKKLFKEESKRRLNLQFCWNQIGFLY